MICVYKRSFSTTLVTMRFAQWFRLSPRCGYHQPTIQSFQNKCNIITVALVFIYIYRWYTPVYAGIRWYRCGIRAVYTWYTRSFSGIRVVYARYTRGICVVYAWYTRGIGWCTLVYAHDPPAPKRREPPAVILSIGSERSSQVTWDMAQDRCSEVMN